MDWVCGSGLLALDHMQTFIWALGPVCSFCPPGSVCPSGQRYASTSQVRGAEGSTRVHIRHLQSSDKEEMLSTKPGCSKTHKVLFNTDEMHFVAV